VFLSLVLCTVVFCNCFSGVTINNAISRYICTYTVLVSYEHPCTFFSFCTELAIQHACCTPWCSETCSLGGQSSPVLAAGPADFVTYISWLQACNSLRSRACMCHIDCETCQMTSKEHHQDSGREAGPKDSRLQTWHLAMIYIYQKRVVLQTCRFGHGLFLPVNYGFIQVFHGVQKLLAPALCSVDIGRGRRRPRPCLLQWLITAGSPCRMQRNRSIQIYVRSAGT
jgi:hypothetical protein